MSILVRCLNDDSGQDLVEYALIAALVSTIGIALIREMGGSISSLWTKISKGIPG